MKTLRILLVGVILSACSSTIVQTPTSIAPKTNTPRVTTIPYTPTSSQSPTATPKNWPISSIPPCINLNTLEATPDDYQISGTMMSIDAPPWSPSTGFWRYSRTLLHFDLLSRIEIDMLNLEDYQGSKKEKLEILSTSDLYPSPDFLKAAFLITAYTSDFERKSSWLEIYSANTGERVRIPWRDEWAYLIGWINDNLLAIREGGSTLLLDASGNIKNSIHTSKYPDYSNPRTYDEYAFVLWGGYRTFDSYSFEGTAPVNLGTDPKIYNPTLEIYNPTMEYVIYTEIVDSRPGIVLYEIKSQQKITEIITGSKVNSYVFGGEPVWSPKGDSAIMLLPSGISSQRLFLLDITGKVEKLTKFPPLGPYKWSPDGNSIAFWLADGKQLGVIDMDTKDLRVFCIDTGYLGEQSYLVNDIPTGGEIVWLPNSNQLLVEMGKVIDGTRYEGIAIIDLEKALFIDLKWSASSPIWLNK